MADDSEYLTMLELQRKNFEAQFGSLESLGYNDNSKVRQDSLSEDSLVDSSEENSRSDSEESEYESDDFHGFTDEENIYNESFSEDEKSSDQEEEQPVVVKFSEKKKESTETPSKKAHKLLSKGKIPSLQKLELKEKLNQIEIENEILKTGGSSKEEMENMQKDIELQRLLSESHILSSAGAGSYSGVDVTLRTINDDPIGKTRAKTITQRLRNLSGTANEKRKLEKMPMHMRKGMLQKEIKRVRNFEQEARDSGTILSKTGKYELRNLNLARANKVGSKSDLIGEHVIGKKKLQEKFAHRKRGLKIQSIGKSTRNGLVINEKELASVIGSGKRGNKGKKGKRR